MSDENVTNTSAGGWGSAGETGGPAAGTEAAGFCQDCGRPLTKDTVRAVGGGVFCEPCLTARVGVPVGTPGYTAVPNYAAGPVAAAVAEPSPGLAFFLGLFPGVGAFYNGQFAKGIVHLVIFAILVSLASDVNGIFGLFVAGWIVYMAFEAHQTAKARLEGMPLPNAFGFNDLGERMGFGKNWGNAGSPYVPRPVNPQADPAAAASGFVPDMAATGRPASDWVGYVPPTAFTSAAGYPQAAYAPAYTGVEYPVAPLAAVPLVPAKRFPVGAFWLIGLGVLILLANLVPDWRLNGRWWLPILFAGLSVWIFTRRYRSGVNLICIIRWPVVLMVLAILFALHAADFAITFGLACSILLIAFGALLLLERTAGAAAVASAPVYPTSYSVVPPSESVAEGGTVAGDVAPSRAMWPAGDNDANQSKGGL